MRCAALDGVLNVTNTYVRTRSPTGWSSGRSWRGLGVQRSGLTRLSGVESVLQGVLYIWAELERKLFVSVKCGERSYLPLIRLVGRPDRVGC